MHEGRSVSVAQDLDGVTIAEPISEARQKPQIRHSCKQFEISHDDNDPVSGTGGAWTDYT